MPRGRGPGADPEERRAARGRARGPGADGAAGDRGYIYIYIYIYIYMYRVKMVSELLEMVYFRFRRSWWDIH